MQVDFNKLHAAATRAREHGHKLTPLPVDSRRPFNYCPRCGDWYEPAKAQAEPMPTSNDEGAS